MYAYPRPEIRQKAETLRDAWFTKQERRDMMEFGLAGKPEPKEIKPVSQSEIIDPLGLPQLISRTPKEFWDKLHFELSKFRDPTQNFDYLFRWIWRNEARDLMEMLNRNANQWLSDMLWNVNNLVRYLEHYPDRARLKGWRENLQGWFDADIATQLRDTMREIRTLRQEKWFVVSPENWRMLRELVQRMNNLPD